MQVKEKSNPAGNGWMSTSLTKIETTEEKKVHMKLYSDHEFSMDTLRLKYCKAPGTYRTTNLQVFGNKCLKQSRDPKCLG